MPSRFVAPHAIGRLVVCLVLTAWCGSSSGNPKETQAERVVFRVVEKPAGSMPSDLADRVRGPDRQLWVVYRAEWATGADVLDVHVTERVELHLAVVASLAKRVSEDPPAFIAAYIDGRMLAVGSMSPGKKPGEIVWKAARPQRTILLARALGASNSMAAGPRVSVSPQSSAMSPGGRMTVDVYATGIASIASYEIVLEVRKGRRGAFLIEGSRVDQARQDFIFAGVPGATSEGVTASVLLKGSGPTATVDPTRASYLGTLVFRAMGNAEGTFTVRVHEKLSKLLDANGKSIPFRAGAASIVVGKFVVPPRQR